MKRLAATCVVGLSLTCLPGNAYAATMQVVAKGVLGQYSSDVFDTFMTGITDLEGWNFTATLLYDPETPGSVRTTVGSPNPSDYVHGEQYSGTTIPVSSAKIDISKVGAGAGSYLFTPDYQGNASINTTSGSYRGESLLNEQVVDANGFLISQDFNSDVLQLSFLSLVPITADLHAAFSLMFPADGSASGYYNGYAYYQAGNAIDGYKIDYKKQVGLSFDIDSLEVSPLNVGVVPLPAGLPLLAGGLSIMALVGWKRRRPASPAVA